MKTFFLISSLNLFLNLTAPARPANSFFLQTPRNEPHVIFSIMSISHRQWWQWLTVKSPPFWNFKCSLFLWNWATYFCVLVISMSCKQTNKYNLLITQKYITKLHTWRDHSHNELSTSSFIGFLMCSVLKGLFTYQFKWIILSWFLISVKNSP